ncbi:MAG TPA: EAL domain-containing protein [Thermoleophilaceae bacterium]|nr:EAL domain-containing protein [Thermoleophilaceae bacterium]
MRAWSRRLGLLGHFSVLSLVLIALLGLFLANLLRSQIDDRAISNAQQSAEQIARIGIQRYVSPIQLRDGLAREQYNALDKAVRADLNTGSLKGVRIWSREGRILYADDPLLVGQEVEPSGGLRTALEGETSSHKEVPEAEHGGGEPALSEELLEVYVPLNFSGDARPAGAFELYLPYAPVAAAIREDTRSLYLALAAGLALLYLGLFRVVAGASGRLRRHAAENKHQALHDALTGLPNRTLFHDRIEQALRQSKRDRQLGGVLLIDLDRFKEVNDTLGHAKGDVLLKDIGHRLREALRASDTIARLGGDEFGVLLPTLDSSAGAVQAAEKIRSALEPDFAIDGLPVHVDASIGIALYPQHGEDVDTLLQHADVAMYEAKRTHSGHEIYSVEHDPYNPVRLAMVGQLRKALEESQVVLHYQPKIDVETGKVVGAEALVRWQHPERGLIAPIEFVPMAERTGLIKPLSRYVLDRALAQCRDWRDAGLDLKVSVNLSARNLLDPRLPEDVSKLLTKWQVPVTHLELEITESTIMIDPKRAMEVLRELHAMGIALSIDDFGTGYSSLVYLKEMPVNELKIDRAFVARMGDSRRDAFIVRSTIDLAHNLRLQVVAEGVEDQNTLDELARLGCNIVQGFHLSHPLPAGEFGDWLADRGESPAPEAGRRMSA